MRQQLLQLYYTTAVCSSYTWLDKFSVCFCIECVDSLCSSAFFHVCFAFCFTLIFQIGNNVSIRGVCRIVASILHNAKLTFVTFNHSPSACVGHDAWQSEGLPVPPSEASAFIYGWQSMLPFLRVRREQFRDSVLSLLCAASALIAIGSCSLPLRIWLCPYNPSLLGAMLSQRSPAFMSLQRKRFLGPERLRLLRCSGPLAALLLRLAAVMDSSGRIIFQHELVARIMKRCFSGAALRLWRAHIGILENV